MTRNILFIFAGAVAATLILELMLSILPVQASAPNLSINSENPIKRGIPNENFTYSNGWNLRISNDGHTNNLGFFSSYDYQQNMSCIAVIGDSYVYASAVSAKDHFFERLNEIENPKSLPVYGFGMHGASISEYLNAVRWVEYNFRPKLVIFLLVEGDVDSSLNAVKQGSTGFLVIGGKVEEVHSNWAPNHSAWFNFFKKSSIFHYFLKIFRLLRVFIS